MCFDLNTLRNIIRSWFGHNETPSYSGERTEENEKSRTEERERTAIARLEYLSKHTRPIDVSATKRRPRVTQSPNREDRRTDTLITDWRN